MIARAWRARSVARPPRAERGGKPEEPERHTAVPRERRQADRRDDHEGGDDRSRERDLATPWPREHEDARDDPDDLREPDDPLDDQRHAEHLEGARERPDPAGSVEVEEVAVRYVAVEEALAEDEHEALLHRRTRAAEQATQRDRDDEEQQSDRYERALP